MILFKSSYLISALAFLFLFWMESPGFANEDWSETPHLTPLSEEELLRQDDQVEIQVEINEPRVETPQVLRALNHQDSNSIQDQALKWEFSHSLFNVFSDLTSLASSALLLCTQFTSDPIFFRLSAGLSSGITLIELFREFQSKIKQIREHPHDLSSISLVTYDVGQVVWGTGLGLLAGGVDPKIGAWVTVSGSLIRFGATTAQLTVDGMAKTFGNDNRITNLIFRIGFLGVGGTSGGIALATGVSSHSSILVSSAIYTLATAGFLGGVEVLTRDVQDVIALKAKLQDPAKMN